MVGSIKRFVVDASFVLSFLLPDEANEKTTKTFLDYKNHEVNLVSTTLLPFEIFNSLRSAVVQKRINLEILKKLTMELEILKMSLLEINFEETLNQSLKHNLSFYDSCYLQLSKELEVPLLTLDKKLAKLAV